MKASLQLGVLRAAAGTAILTLGLFSASGSTYADTYPSKMVKIIVPTAPGGSIDTTARIVAERLNHLWGQPVIVDNRPGASMMIGAEAAAKAPPDGYTLMIVHDGAMSINAAVYPKLKYNPQRDFEPVALISTIPLVMLANPSFEAKSIQDLLALAKAKPGALNHANGGPGTLLPSQLFKSMAKIDYLEVPYKGASLAITSTIAGDTQITIADLASSNAFIKPGKLRPLGIASAHRSKSFPDLPTIAESGVPGYESRMWIGAFAPAGTPKAITDKIGADIRKILATPEVKAKMASFSMDVVGGSGEDLAKTMRSDTEKWSRLVKEHNLTIE
jgi:tripartite-type tricarboxylate transporter receptor subunit TctC